MALLVYAPCAAETEWEMTAFKGWQSRELIIQGIDANLAKELRQGLALSQTSGLLGLQRPLFFPQVLEEDLQRATLFLARRGYPYATVTPRFEGNPRREEVRVILVVDPGPAVAILSLTIAGLPSDLEDSARETVALQSGAVFTDDALTRAVADLGVLLDKSGFAKANVKTDMQWPDSTHVAVQIDVESGNRYHYGDLVIAGASDDLIALVNRTAGLERGRVYHPQDLVRAQRNLRLLGLFRQIRLGFADSIADTLDVRADLLMREYRTLETNIRYWSEDKLDYMAKWTHRNFFKKGRGASALIAASAYRQKLQFDGWWPAFLMARNRANLMLGAERLNEQNFEQTSTGGELSFNYEYSLQTSLRAGISTSFVDIVETAGYVDSDLPDEGLLSSLRFNWRREGGNEPIVPTSGTITNIALEWTPRPPLSDFTFAGVMPSISAFFPLGGTVNLATRLEIGLATPLYDATEIIASKRFYAGGANSHRGFNRRKLGPLDENGTPLGGESKLITSLELRFPLFWKFRGTCFADAGQVWAQVEASRLDNIEVAIGPGLWLETIIGPLRADLAYRITDYAETQPRVVFSFSIGPAF